MLHEASLLYEIGGIIGPRTPLAIEMLFKAGTYADELWPWCSRKLASRYRYYNSGWMEV